MQWTLIVVNPEEISESPQCTHDNNMIQSISNFHESPLCTQNHRCDYKFLEDGTNAAASAHPTAVGTLSWKNLWVSRFHFNTFFHVRFFFKKSYISNKDGTDLTAAANSTPVSAVKTLSVRPPLKKKNSEVFSPSAKDPMITSVWTLRILSSYLSIPFQHSPNIIQLVY